MNRIKQIIQKDYQKLKQENTNLKNDLSAHRQRVENEIRQQEFRIYQAKNEHLKNKRKNNDKSNDFDTACRYISEKILWTMMMMMMDIIMKMIKINRIKIIRIPTKMRPTRMMMMREKI